MSSDLTFLTNESGKTLRDRFSVLLKDVTQPYEDTVVNRSPFAHSLLTYLRQGRFGKFFIAPPGATESRELDFFATAKTIKPTNSVEKRGERVITGRGA